LLRFISLCFNFDFFFSTSQEIGWKEHLRYDLFGVKWDIKPFNLISQSLLLQSMPE